jgi:hypothetical protein
VTRAPNPTQPLATSNPRLEFRFAGVQKQGREALPNHSAPPVCEPWFRACATGQWTHGQGKAGQGETRRSLRCRAYSWATRPAPAARAPARYYIYHSPTRTFSPSPLFSIFLLFEAQTHTHTEISFLATTFD